MGPNNQLVSKPSSTTTTSIKMGTFSQSLSIINGPTRHLEVPFNDGNGINVVDLNHNEMGMTTTTSQHVSHIITGSLEGMKSVSICKHRSKQAPKNGLGQKRNEKQREQQHAAVAAEQRKHFKRIFKCNFCSYVTDRRNNLARHVNTMHDACKQLLECCGMRFESKATFRYHINECHREGYSCTVCGHNFHRKALLKRHMSIHSGRKEFICSECNYGTSHKSNLERHKKVHSKEFSNQKNEEQPPKTSPTTTKPTFSIDYPKAATTVITTNPMTSPREGTAPSELDLGLPLKKRLLRLGDNFLTGSTNDDNKQTNRNYNENDRKTTTTETIVVEQTQPLDLHIEPHNNHRSIDTNLSMQMYPMNEVTTVPWTLLAPSTIYSYKTTTVEPRHVSYPNLYSVMDPRNPLPHHHHHHSEIGLYNRENRVYIEAKEEEMAIRPCSSSTSSSNDTTVVGRNRIMATPYKCFECNCRFSSQFSLALHLQSCHPMADVVTLSIVTVLNNMNKVKNRNKRTSSNNDDDDEHHEDHRSSSSSREECQYQKEELQQFLLTQLSI